MLNASQQLSLEDGARDVVAKAMRGLARNTAHLALMTGLDPKLIEKGVESGVWEEAHLRTLAPALDLDGDALVSLWRDEWYPEAVIWPEGLVRFTTDYKGIMSVHAYALVDSEERTALLFDTGADADLIRQWLEHSSLTLGGVFITHGHGDHIGGLAALRGCYPNVRVWSRETLPCPCSEVQWGEVIQTGKWMIHPHRTSGHAALGTSYQIQWGGRRLMFVGDCLFAGSMGGAPSAYAEALEWVLIEVLSQPLDTILLPGHGPSTTVAEERANNPFFSGKFRP